jgi:serine/threonine-protein kinase
MPREDFEIVDQKPIGRGQFGTVFLGRRRSDGRSAALKLILHHGENGEATIAAERHGAILQQEFAARHGMVPEVFDFGPDGEDFYIAMELVHGPSLEERLRSGRLPMTKPSSTRPGSASFSIGRMRSAPRSSSNPYRLLHNDLKPAHLKIPEIGERKVLDFGMAKVLEQARDLATDVGRTIAYAAPERLRSERVNVHADFWSLGVMLYEMVSGHRPYPQLEDPRLRRQLYSAITSNAPRAPLPPDCPPHLQAIIHRLLAFQPAHRYQTAGEILADLERYVRREHRSPSLLTTRPATTPVIRGLAIAVADAPPVASPSARILAPAVPPTGSRAVAPSGHCTAGADDARLPYPVPAATIGRCARFASAMAAVAVVGS